MISHMQLGLLRGNSFFGALSRRRWNPINLACSPSWPEGGLY